MIRKAKEKADLCKVDHHETHTYTHTNKRIVKCTYTQAEVSGLYFYPSVVCLPFALSSSVVLIRMHIFGTQPSHTELK